MQTKNDQLNLTDHIESLKSKMDSFPITSSAVSDCSSDTMFCFETLNGGRIDTTAVRELYVTGSGKTRHVATHAQ